MVVLFSSLPKKYLSFKNLLKSYFVNPKHKMEKFDEINEDNIKELSLEDLQKLALSWKNELISSRWVIWGLNKKIKESSKGWDDEWGNNNFSKEDMENYLEENKQKEELESFITGNPAFEEKKDKISDLMWKGLSLAEAKWAVISSDETFKNNLNTNQAWISWWDPTWNKSFSNKQSYENYNSMSKDEQTAYKDACDKTYGWLTFSDTHTAED